VTIKPIGWMRLGYLNLEPEFYPASATIESAPGVFIFEGWIATTLGYIQPVFAAGSPRREILRWFAEREHAAREGYWIADNEGQRTHFGEQAKLPE
jgi:hypothetical protein